MSLRQSLNWQKRHLLKIEKFLLYNKNIKMEGFMHLQKLEYVCCNCKATNCKLWRESYSTVPFLCAICTLQKEGKDYTLDQDGRHQCNYQGFTDKIENSLPAVLTEDEVTVYGYTSVPEHLVAKWRNLPTYPTMLI